MPGSRRKASFHGGLGRVPAACPMERQTKGNHGNCRTRTSIDHLGLCRSRTRQSQPSKLVMRVRFPSPAPNRNPAQARCPVGEPTALIAPTRYLCRRDARRAALLKTASALRVYGSVLHDLGPCECRVSHQRGRLKPGALTLICRAARGQKGGDRCWLARPRRTLIRAVTASCPRCCAASAAARPSWRQAGKPLT